jgi:hypothetical protein
VPTQRTRWKRAEKKKKKNPGINPGQPARKGREKKTLVLTLGSPPEKGGKKEKKTLVLTLGRPPDLNFRTWSCPSVEVLSVRRGPETKIGTWTHGQTDS